MDYILLLFTILLLYQAIVPFIEKKLQERTRITLIQKIEKKRHSRVITIIHRQETISFLGIPIQRSLSVEDSEQILRAIHMTPDDKPIDLVLHTPGGLVLAAEQIAYALKRHKGKVTVFIPHYAMSGGTMLAIAADEIVMSQDAVMSGLDPQIGSFETGFYPAVSILKALEKSNPHRDDQTLILGDVAQKAIQQVYDSVYNLLLRHKDKTTAKQIAIRLTKGGFTHDHPLLYEEIKELGFNVTDNLPMEIYYLLSMYTQPQFMGKSVEYIPSRYNPTRRK